MALADIKEKILAEAKNEKETILREARGKKEQLLGAAKEYAASLKKDNDEKVKKEVPLVLKRREAVANLDVRKYMLSAKRKLINQAFDSAARHITDLSGEAYGAFMAKLLKNAVETGHEEVLLGLEEQALNAAWVEGFNSANNTSLTFSSERSPRGNRGFILCNGPIEINCTVEMLVRSMRDDLEADVAKRLFASK